MVGDEAILKSDVENERLNAQYENRRFEGDPYSVHTGRVSGTRTAG